MSKRTPTPQQAACIEAIKQHDIIKILSAAGSGKTSVLSMMAEAYPAPSLYLAFNKATAMEAAEKFPSHVQCRTTHSMAYAKYGADLRDKLSRPKGKYVNVAGTGGEIGRYFKIEPIEHAREIVLSQAFMGLLVKRTVERFEQSADTEIGEQHIPYGDLKEKQRTHTFSMSETKRQLVKYAKKLWKERTSVKSPVLASHDTYLKKYSLSKPIFEGIEVLYVDEYQDTTPCVMDIVLNQVGHMKIVCCGDEKQAIYSFRGAINALKMLPAETFMLTKSFRYGQAVADVATAILERSMVVEGHEAIQSVVGREDVVDRTKPYTRLFRTNAALLEAAIAELRRGTEVAIEVDTKDFVKLLTSAQALREGNMKGVKHDKVLPFNNWKELLDETPYDGDLGRVSKIVNNGDTEKWIEILECHVNAEEPHVTFVSCHRSKGREWQQVIVEDDFKSAYSDKGDWIGLPEEEVNLLYVACTRAIDRLQYNQTTHEYLMPRRKRREEFGGAQDDVDLRREFNEVRQLIRESY